MEENSIILKKIEKLLFFFRVKSLAREFCCGCKLKMGNLFISVIFLILMIIHILSINSTIDKSKITTTLMTVIAFNLFLSSILILISTIRLNIKLAYYGYLINATSFYIELATYVIYIIFVEIGVIDLEFGSNEDLNIFSLLMVVVMFGIMFLLLVFFRVYLAWINYSFVIYLAREEYAFLEGRGTDTASTFTGRLNNL